MNLHSPLEELARWFDRDHFALVCTEQRSYTGGNYSTVTVITGVVTRVDLLSFIATKGGESPVVNVRRACFCWHIYGYRTVPERIDFAGSRRGMG